MLAPSASRSMAATPPSTAAPSSGFASYFDGHFAMMWSTTRVSPSRCPVATTSASSLNVSGTTGGARQVDLPRHVLRRVPTLRQRRVVIHHARVGASEPRPVVLGCRGLALERNGRVRREPHTRFTPHSAHSTGHKHYFGCNLLCRNVLMPPYQHLVAQAPQSE